MTMSTKFENDGSVVGYYVNPSKGPELVPMSITVSTEPKSVVAWTTTKRLTKN